MTKSRNRKKCKRAKKVKEDVIVDVKTKTWITPNGNVFCKSQEKATIFDTVMKDPRKLLFEIITRENANAFIKASKNDPRCQIFVKEFYGYLTKICEKWKSFKIGKSLNKTVPKHLKSSISDQVDNPVSYCQLRAYLNDVMNFLFTDFLLGEQNTKLFVNKLVYSLFNIRRDEPIFMENYILRCIESTKIGWLERFCFKTGRVLLQCVIKFLCEFFQELINKTFYTVFDNVDKIRFYRIEIWDKLSGTFAEKFIAARQARELQLLPNDHYYVMWFVPKSKGFRPIEQLKEVSAIRYSPGVNVKEYLKIVNRVLIAVTKTKSFGFGIHNLKQFAHQLRVFASRNSNVKEFYCFSGDITNCFPAIEHNFLTKSLNEMITDEGPFIHAKFLVTTKDGKNYYKPTVGIKTLADAKKNLEKTCRYVADSCTEMKRITKSELIETIQRYAMKNIFKFKQKFYRCFRGVPQGSALSTLLCTIYLAQMEKELFFNSANNIRIHDLFGDKAIFLRYVDDYLLISTDKEIAENSIQKLVNDSKNYSMKLNEEKTVMTSNLSHLQQSQTSLSKCRFIDSAERIKWCGFAINTVSLTVTPDTSRFHRHPFSIPSKLLNGKFLNKTAKQKERCEWILTKIRQSLMMKRKCMRICRRIYRRKARKTAIFYSILRCIKNYYLKYFKKRFGVRSCGYFKPIHAAIHSFVRATFKRKFQNVQS